MRVLLLGPGYYRESEHRDALHDRYRLAEYLAPHEVSIMELADSDAPGLAEKFAELMDVADEVVVWLPKNGKLASVFGELLLLRAEHEWHGKPVWIFAEEDVLDVTGHEFRVIHETGQMAYLLDLTQVLCSLDFRICYGPRFGVLAQGIFAGASGWFGITVELTR